MIKLQTLEPYVMNKINEYQRIIAKKGFHRMLFFHLVFPLVPPPCPLGFPPSPLSTSFLPSSLSTTDLSSPGA